MLGLNIPPQKLFQWFKGHCYGQLVIGSFIMTMHPLMNHVLYRVFWTNVKSPRWLSPLQPRFGTLQLLAFPKTKITFERDRISDHRRDSGKYDREDDDDWENFERSQGSSLEGDWGVIVLCTVLLVSSSINLSFLFLYYMAGYLLDKPCISFIFYLCTFILHMNYFKVSNIVLFSLVSYWLYYSKFLK